VGTDLISRDLGVGPADLDRALRSPGWNPLGAVHLRHKIGRVTGRDIGLQELLATTSAREILTLASQAATSGQWMARQQTWPAPPQQRLYESLLGDKWWSSPMNVSATVRIDSGRVDDTALNIAMRELIRRHSSLRAGFGKQSGQLMLNVGEAADAEVERKSFATEADLRDHARRDIVTAIDRTRPPLLRIIHYTARDGADYLSVIADHGVCDGWGLKVIAQDLRRLYSAAKSGATAPAEYPAQIAEWIEYQNTLLSPHYRDRLQAMWDSQVGKQPAALQAAFPVSAGGEVCWASLRVPGLARATRAEARARLISPFTVAGGATCFCVARYLGVDDLAVMTNVLNRGSRDLRATVASCTAELWMYLEGLGSGSREAVVQDLAARNSAVASFASVSMDVVSEHLWPSGRLLECRPRVYFGMMYGWGTKLTLAGAGLEAVSLGRGFGSPGISVNIEEDMMDEYVINVAVRSAGLGITDAIAIGSEIGSFFSCQAAVVDRHIAG
jgi:hypothetical protein